MQRFAVPSELPRSRALWTPSISSTACNGTAIHWTMANGRASGTAGRRKRCSSNAGSASAGRRPKVKRGCPIHGPCPTTWPPWTNLTARTIRSNRWLRRRWASVPVGAPARKSIVAVATKRNVSIHFRLYCLLLSSSLDALILLISSLTVVVVAGMGGSSSRTDCW